MLAHRYRSVSHHNRCCYVMLCLHPGRRGLHPGGSASRGGSGYWGIGQTPLLPSPWDTTGAGGRYASYLKAFLFVTSSKHRKHISFLHFVEKFYRPLVNLAVPVVLATKDIRKIAPPHSYIDVRDFKSPKHLAEYLLHLDKNETAYLSYFDWRKDYTVVAGKRSSIDVFCHLCRYMHTNNTARVAKNFRDWFFRQSECRNPDPEIKFH